jgi:hypothetical protein
LQIGLLTVFSIAGIWSAGSLVTIRTGSVLAKDVIPGKVEGEESREEAKTHDKATILIAE